jgi:hypothetical protein
MVQHRAWLLSRCLWFLHQHGSLELLEYTLSLEVSLDVSLPLTRSNAPLSFPRWTYLSTRRWLCNKAHGKDRRSRVRHISSTLFCTLWIEHQSRSLE